MVASGTRDEIAEALRHYYANQNIHVGPDFACQHRGRCERLANPRPLMKGMEAHIGHRYGERGRIVVVSLDSGNSSEDLDARTATIEPITPENAGNWHMQGTAKFVKLLVDSDTPPDQPMAFVAMLNSAKCAGADGRMNTVPPAVHYRCRAYLLGELRILNPALIWLQGRTVRDVLSDRLSTSRDIGPALQRYLGNKYQDIGKLAQRLESIAREYVHLLRLWDEDVDTNKQIVAVVTPHPSDRYGRWGLFERAMMPLVADLTAAFSSN